MVLSSVNPSFAKIFLVLFQDGPSPLSLVVTHSVINISALISRLMVLVNSKSLSSLKMVVKKFVKPFLNLQEEVVLLWVCTTLSKVLNHLLTVVSITPSTVNILFISPQRILSSSNTMVYSRIFLKNYTQPNTKKILKRTDYGMNIVLSMIWLPKFLKVMVVLFGHVKIMTVMSKVILLLKVMVLWV